MLLLERDSCKSRFFFYFFSSSLHYHEFTMDMMIILKPFGLLIQGAVCGRNCSKWLGDQVTT